MNLQTIKDWKKLVSMTAKHFEQNRWNQITNVLASGENLMDRCFNGGMLCNTGFDLSKARDLDVYGEDYYEEEGHKIQVLELGLTTPIHCSLHENVGDRIYHSIPNYIGHLNDEHVLKGNALKDQFYKDVNTAIRRSKEFRSRRMKNK